MTQPGILLAANQILIYRLVIYLGLMQSSEFTGAHLFSVSSVMPASRFVSFSSILILG